MKTVDALLSEILRREGGFVNHKADRGKATNFGITQGTYSLWLGRHASVADVKAMTETEAREIYEADYLRKPGIDKLPPELQPLVLDSSVNHGPAQAIRMLQRVCNYVGAELVEDGVLGPKTASAVAGVMTAIGARPLLAMLWLERRSFYQDIVLKNESQRVFIKGWLSRLSEFSPRNQDIA